ncbi:MAG: hypothetical protein HYX47_06195 [Burkholderiales bacterium]|nr:hypothetical protein [Burkholderiales bacterium]
MLPIVLRSTPESIRRGIPSVIAILETLVAVAAYFLFIHSFGWVFPTLLISFTAPALLLRSGPGVKFGKRLLESAIKNEKPGKLVGQLVSGLGSLAVLYVLVGEASAYIAISPWAVIPIVVLGFVFLVAYATSGLGQLHGLAEITEVGYAFMGITMAIALLVAIPGIIAAMGGAGRFGLEIPSSLLILAVAVVGIAPVPFVLKSMRRTFTDVQAVQPVETAISQSQPDGPARKSWAMSSTGRTGAGATVRHMALFLLTLSACLAAAIIVVLLAVSTFAAGFIVVLLSAGASLCVLGGAGLGVMCLGISIRAISSLRYASCGVRSLPANWIQQIFVIDVFHAPELLPRAARVSPEYDIRGLLNASMSLPQGYQRASAYAMATFIYVSALVYRFSIKGTAWIWWPLVIAARRPFWNARSSHSRIRRHIAIQVLGPNGLMLGGSVAALLGACTYLILGSEESWLGFLPRAAVELLEALRAVNILPMSGLRLTLLIVTLSLACLHWWQGSRVLGAFDQPLKSPKAFGEMEVDEREAFLRMAARSERIRFCLIASTVALIESQLLYAAQR